ncbi:MAG: hypothetical protein AB7J13_09025 [Pyrinomonadaceae bacterium]
MFRSKYLLSIALLAVLGIPAAAQKALEKPIDQWSQKDAIQILNESPWTKSYQSLAGSAAASQAEALRAQSDNSLTGAERGRSERFGAPAPLIMRLHSGLPIRLALVRLNQIGANYDKMNDEAKIKFNETAKPMIDCSVCQNYYVVTLTKIANPSGQAVEEAIFEGMTLEDLKGHLWLKNDKGETRQLAQFIAPKKRGDSAVFFFPRKDDKGTVLLTKENKELMFIFDPGFLSGTNRFAYLLPKQFEFKVSKITVGDQVVF